jgi:hypothetical protein
MDSEKILVFTSNGRVNFARWLDAYAKHRIKLEPTILVSAQRYGALLSPKGDSYV